MSKTIISSTFFTTILVLSFILFSCKKEPETTTETTTLIKTIIEKIPDTATTFILVRHAETTGVGGNPNLSTLGQSRAIELNNIMSNVPLNAVFSTNYNRTMQTAQPTANGKTLTVQNYNPSNLNSFVDNSILNYHEGVILVVGHSNTTPSLLNILVGSTNFLDIPETEYNNLYIVTLFEKGRANVTHLKYGL